jgi:hypothetical protein
MKISADDIFPLVVPASYNSKAWALPHYKLPNSSFILTWVTSSSGATMNYLTQEQHQSLSSIDEDWQKVSFENLRRSIRDNENFFSQYKMSKDGQRLIFLAFLNSDGIGSSRILLSYELRRAFSHGYYLAFPDRSCGLVVAKDITDKELNETRKLVKSMYKGATTPMSDELHQADEFLLPADWTQPVDLDFSSLLTNEIFKLRPVSL